MLAAGAVSMLAAVPAMAAPIIAATNAERAAGFDTIADCERALGSGAKHRAAAQGGKEEPRGSLFNRAAGNLSRCEMVDGEALVVVYPAPAKAAVTD